MTDKYTMPPDVECPYCGEGQEICHDDGYGYKEDELHQQECHNCEKTFGYRTSISFSYEAEKVACFNGEKCNFIESHRHTVDNGQTVVFSRCTECDTEKQELSK